jgi:hypothetical protein
MMQFDPFDWEDHKHTPAESMIDKLSRFLYRILCATNETRK